MARYVDLTHTIDPDNPARKFDKKLIGADTVNHNVVRLKNQWYIMHEITLVSHVGTHIEAPYHIFKDGRDLSQLDLDTLCGEAVVLKLNGLSPKQEITESIITQSAQSTGGIKKGDIVFVNLGYSKYYGTDDFQKAPFFSTEAIKWLIAQGMKLMGVDTGGVEIPQSEQHVNHSALFENDIPLIECLNNLDAVETNRCFVTAFVYPIKGVESFPVRVVAHL